MLISKIIGAWIQRPDMQMVFEFQVNRMKIEDFRNLTYVDLLAYSNLKIIGDWIQRSDMQMLFKVQVNRMKIEDFRKVGQN